MEQRSLPFRWDGSPEQQEGDFKPISNDVLKRMRLFAEQEMLEKKLPYHNWGHVRRFMRDADFLAVREHLTQLQRENVMIAAMFHDIGNIIARKGHEEIGRQILHELLLGTELEPRRAEIERLVIATDYTREPKTLDEKIMRDADIASKGRRFLGGFFYTGRKLRREMKEAGTFPKTEGEWLDLCEQILSVPFYTATAQKHWDKGRLANIASIKRQKQYLKLRTKVVRPVRAFLKSWKKERPRAK